jgi:thymidylate synthase ThyX
MSRNIDIEIVADSINPAGKRITSALWTYPRFIHAEIMTHRMFSRNAASSRAIPIKKMMQAVREDPAMPEWWGSNKPGMQAGEQLDGEAKADALTNWLAAKTAALSFAEELESVGLHKQIANRVLEPWMRITVLVTATEWDNFFALRAHPAAQPEFQILAYRMLNAMVNLSQPKYLNWGEWHVPFDPGTDKSLHDRLVTSVAKAARTSYVAFDSNKTLEEQETLFKSMRDNGHWSPFEHQAQAVSGIMHSGNFTGNWRQYRQEFGGQNREHVDLAALLAAKPAWIEL